MFLENRKKKEKHGAAIKIQTYWRMYSAKKVLKKLKDREDQNWLNINATRIQVNTQTNF